MDYLAMVTGLCGGLGLFLYGMHVMAKKLKKTAGGNMKRLLEMLTKNKYIGILVGALVTAIIQSSSATTVMVVGFVNAGLMNLTQAVGIIMGANIGTTITSWLVSSAEFLQTDTLAPIAIFFGAAMLLFAKKAKHRDIGEIIIGFGALFIGIEMMSSGVAPLSELEGFKEIFKEFGRNPVLGILVGTFVTALIQSSSASVGILIALAHNGLVTFDSAVYIIMGQNIGTCATALLSSLGASKNAKGAAYIHLLFNVIGSVIFSIVAVIFFKISPEVGQRTINEFWISIVHTSFNVANTIIMIPFSSVLVKIAEFLCNAKKVTDDESEVLHLDDRILNTPSIAIINCGKEIVHLANLAKKNLVLSFDAVLNKDKKAIEKIFEREEKIDNLTKYITQYLVKICDTDITSEENDYITSLFHTVHDIERMGDHCENLAEFAQNLIEDNLDFSESGKNELKDMFDEAKKCVENSISAFENGDIKDAQAVIREEERIDNLEKTLRQKHIERLSKNQCSPLVGVIYLDIVTNVERISDLALNVAQAVIKNKTV